LAIGQILGASIVSRTLDQRICYSRNSMLVHTTSPYSKLARIIFGVLCLLCTDQIVNAVSRPIATHSDQCASARNTQSGPAQAGAADFPTRKPPRSSTPYFVEVAFVPTLKNPSCEPRLVHQLAAEIVHSFDLNNLTTQPTTNILSLCSYSIILAFDSSGRSPPRQS